MYSTKVAIIAGNGEHKVKNIFLYNMLKTLDLFGTKEPTQTPFGLCLNQQSERYRVKS